MLREVLKLEANHFQSENICVLNFNEKRDHGLHGVGVQWGGGWEWGEVELDK